MLAAGPQLDVGWLAGGFADSSVRVYDASKAPLKGVKSQRDEASVLRGHSRPVYGLDFSPDSSLLLSASGDGTVRLWSTDLFANLVAYRCVPAILQHIPQECCGKMRFNRHMRRA